MSPTRKIGDPLYTTFQKIFTIIRIFLKSEAPKAPGLFTFVHRGGLDDIFDTFLKERTPAPLTALNTNNKRSGSNHSGNQEDR